MKQAEIDQGVGEGVEISDSITIAKMRAFNAKIDCLAIDAFSCRTLIVKFLVELTLSVERIAQARANTGRQGNRAAAFASRFVMKRARLFDEFVGDVLGKERANILAALMFDDGDRSVGIGE